MKNINQITFCAIISALNVVLMFLGSVFCHANLLISACCGYLNAITAHEIKFSRAICSHFIIIVLASLFVARKSILIEFCVFSGIYPILETKFSPIKNYMFKILIKTSIFLTCSLFIIGFNAFLIGLYNIPTKNTSHIFLVSYFLTIIWCFCFDYFLQDFKTIYISKIRPKIVMHLR